VVLLNTLYNRLRLNRYISFVVLLNTLYNRLRLNKYLSFVVLSDTQVLFVEYYKIQYIYSYICIYIYIHSKIFGCSHVRTLQHSNSLLKTTYKMTSWSLAHSVRIFLKLSWNYTVLKPSSMAHIHTFIKFLQALNLHHQTVHCHANNSHTLDPVPSLSSLLHTLTLFQYNLTDPHLAYSKFNGPNFGSVLF
jgi:hypothetical protein